MITGFNTAGTKPNESNQKYSSKMYEAKCLVMDYQQTNSVHQQHLHQLHPFAPAAAAAAADASSRWSQYQQLWRQHQMFINVAY
ncbi:hypothetical protein PGB90_007923 [Kerria lacca]